MRSGEREDVFSNGDDFRADSVAGEESDAVATASDGGGGAAEG